MRYRYVLILLVLCPYLNLYAQEIPAYSPEQLSTMLDEYRQVYQLEKAYLHLDKPYYSLGESIWFTAYLRDIYTLQKSQISATLYVDLIDPDGKIVQSLDIYMDSSHCQGNFDLGLDEMPGRYRIRAYTSWMRNYGEEHFFEQEVPVYALRNSEDQDTPLGPSVGLRPASIPEPLSDQRELQFFPEGGHMVRGLLGRVGVKLESPSGKGQAFEATLFDSLGQVVLTFAGNERGMASFTFTPSYQSGYYVLLDTEMPANARRFSLPECRQEGMVLAVRNLEDRLAKVNIAFSSPELNQGGKLLIVSRQQAIAMLPLKPSQANLRFSVPLTQIRDGILRFTLFDHLDRPLAERVLFTYQKPALSGKLDQARYQARDTVTLTLKLTDQQGQALKGKASAAVVDHNLVQMETKAFNLPSELLMSPEIKGTLEAPSWYFWNYNEEKRKALDLLMLTQAWRAYQWMPRLRDAPPGLQFIPEKGITISGATRGLINEDKAVKTQVTMVSTKGPFQYGEVITTDSGAFTFTGMVFFDSVNLVFQAYKYNVRRQKATENRNVTLSLFERKPPKVLPLGDRIPIQEPLYMDEYLSERKRIEQIKRTFDPLSLTLDTVAITANAQDRFGSSSAASSEVLYRANLDSLPGALVGSIWEYLNLDLQTRRIIAGFGQLSGGIVVDEGGDQAIEDFNDFIPVWLDGFQLTEQDARTLPISNISVIEVLFSADVATAQGTENGAIMLYSRNGYGGQATVVRGINGIEHPGFHLAKVFYQAPNQDIEDLETLEKPERRVTLHWEPLVYFNQEGQASITFVTDDKSTSYLIQIEGISEDGRPFFKTLELVNE